MEDAVRRLSFRKERIMKKLSEEEFSDRAKIVARARKIFLPHLTKNISIAFELYQEVLAEQERIRFLTTVNGGRISLTWLDQYERLVCPLCDEPLYLRIIREPKGVSNQKGWKTCWECLGPTCAYEEYSEKSVEDWIKQLKRRSE